jgi:hypothetical protein
MTSAITVRDLFIASDNGQLDAGVRVPIPEGAAQFLGPFEWEALRDRVFDLLDINVVDVLVGGWKTHQDVRRQLQLTATDPSLTAVVHLAHHTIDSSHAPSIELRAQGRKVLALSFPMELAFEIDAVELTLRGGRVREIRPGAIKVQGTVKLENAVLLQRESSPLVLPGRITIGEPAAAIGADIAGPLQAAAMHR